MANYNKVILVGNLTRDPQMSYLPSQTPVVELGLAVNRKYKRQDGQQGEETCFIDCRAFGRTAEVLNQYVRKGQPILIEGRLQFDSWEGKDGQKRSKHRVFVENFQFLGSPGGGGGGGGGGRGAPGPGQAYQEPYRGGPPQGRPDDQPPPPQDDGGQDEAIPF